MSVSKVRKFTEKVCMRYTKEEIQKYANKLNISPSGTRRDLCKRIYETLKEKNDTHLLSPPSRQYRISKKQINEVEKFSDKLCMRYSKSEIKAYAKLLGLNPENDKKTLCANIYEVKKIEIENKKNEIQKLKQDIETLKEDLEKCKLNSKQLEKINKKYKEKENAKQRLKREGIDEKNIINSRRK